MRLHSYRTERSGPLVKTLCETTVSFEEGSREMDSTDSPGDNHRTGASACGLVSSLFPASCRGRAEAFARRLHHRLTSLSDTDAISTNTTNAVVTVAAAAAAIDDDEEEGLSSPDQVVSAVELASLFVNHSERLKANHHDACHCTANKRHSEEESNDLESGYLFSSPVNGTTPSDDDNSEAYYDPQSSDGDSSIRTDNFFDPINTSDSDKTFNTSNPTKSGFHRPPAARRKADLCDSRKAEDTSESSSSSVANGRVKKLEELEKKSGVNCSSEESLNDIVSSLDTTSPSHESLWSTFDESTISLEDNNSPSITTLPLKDHIQVICKSYSDSELIASGVRVPTVNINSASSSDQVDSSDNCVQKNKKIEELIVGTTSDDSGTDLTDDDNSTYSSTIDIPGALVIECSLNRQQLPTSTAHEILKNEVNLKIGENFDSNGRIDGISQLSEKFSALSCNNCNHTVEDNNVEKVVKNHKNEQEDKKGVKEEQDNDEKEEEEEEEGEEEEEERPQRVRRCSSLKTGKTPPGTPGRKKIVRFADVLGLDLADVRTFLDEIPKVPNSAFSDLVYDQVFLKDSSPSLYETIVAPRHSLFRSTSDSFATLPAISSGGIKPDKMLVPLFQQPGDLANFLDIIRERQVCLENVIIQDPISMCIEGTVRVRNLDFHKSVHIRYTLDSWRNFSDLQALYVSNSCDGFSDKFTFRLYCHNLKVGARLELAVRFQCKGAQYWDNNLGSNYCFQCLPASLPVSYIPITSAHHNCNVHDWSPTFY